METEVWHERGCGRIGEMSVGIRFTMDLGEGWWRHTDCRCPLAGEVPDQSRLADFLPYTHSTLFLRRDYPVYRHVEHPRYAQDDARTQRQRLDGWLSAILAIPDPATRAAVSESLTVHIARHGEVP